MNGVREGITAINAPVSAVHVCPTPAKRPALPEGWIDAERVSALARCSVRHARRLLSAWERDALEGRPAPRTQRWRSGGRGRPLLVALEADVRETLGLTNDDAADAA